MEVTFYEFVTLSVYKFYQMLSNSKRGVEFEMFNGQKRTFNWNDIIYFKSDGYLTDLHYFEDDEVKKASIDQRIGQIEEDLDFQKFNIYRSHRSYLINLDNMMPYGNYPPDELRLKGDLTVKLSRRRKLDFHKFYKQVN